MTTEASTAPLPADRERAERILAAARELLLAWGYKRVTVDEIARRARVGKGTVYLHWKTKEVLFAELMRREFHDALGLIAARIEQDAGAALPGRLVPEVFREQIRSPLARAILTSDGDVLGTLAMSRDGHPVAQQLGFHSLLARLVDVWRDHALLTAEPSAADQVCVIDTVLAGFFSGGVAVPADQVPTPEHRATLLGHVIKSAVEPPTPPTPTTVHAAARDIISVLTATRTELSGG